MFFESCPLFKLKVLQLTVFHSLLDLTVPHQARLRHCVVFCWCLGVNRVPGRDQRSFACSHSLLVSPAEERRAADVPVLQTQAEAAPLPEPQQDRHQHADGRGTSARRQQAQRPQGQQPPEPREHAAVSLSPSTRLNLSVSSVVDGRSHGSSNERAPSMAAGQSRVLRCP